MKQNIAITNSVEEMRKHLISRHVDLELHNPSLTDRVATFLMYNLSGEVVGYQRYTPSFPSASPRDGRQSNVRDRRYYNYVSSGKIGSFGVETFNLNVPCVFITEGVFDACRLTRRGLCAIAMLTNNPSSSMKNFLKLLGKPIVAVCDDDKAGMKLRNSGHYFETVQDGKDLGECSEEFVDYLVRKYCC